MALNSASDCWAVSPSTSAREKLATIPCFLRSRSQFVELVEDRHFEQLFGFVFFRAANIHFGLDDRHEAGRDDLLSCFELLVHDVLDAGCVGLLDDRAHLGSEDALRFGFVEQRSKRGHGLHQLDPVLLSCKALVHFQKRHNTFHGPKIVRGRPPLDVSVHGVLEQDGGNNPLAGEAGAGNDARAHLMHDRKHLILVGPRTFFDSVKTQRAGRAATALIQRRNETGMCLHFLQLLFVQAERFHNASLSFRYRRIRLLLELSWLKAGSALLSSSGIMRWANTLPSSTPHWSNESMFQITPWVKTLCS